MEDLEREIIRLQEALKDSEEYARNIIDSSMEMIIAVDKERKIIEFNKAAEEIFGYTKSEVIGRHINLLYADTNEGDEINKTIVINGRCSREITNVKKNGTKFPAVLYASILKNSEGEVVGYTGISLDITEQKKMQQELVKAREEAEEANRLKSLFIAKLSHEIKNLIQCIDGSAELLLLKELSDEELLYTKLIKDSSEMLNGIVKNILDYSKIESGKIKINSKQFNFKVFLRNVHELYNMQAERKYIYFNSTIDKDIPETVYGDEFILMQILNNLIGNAIKFTELGGVDFMVDKVDEDIKNVWIQFTVSDTGIGIPKEKIENLFIPFSQVEDSYFFKGTGLGLAICKNLITNLNGEIKVESERGKGSRFSFTLRFQK